MKKTTKAMIIAVTAITAWLLSVSAAPDKRAADKITSDTFIHKTTVFLTCGHTETTDFPAPYECIDKSAKDAAYILGGTADSFKNNILSVKANEDSYCSRHFRLFLDGSTIKVEVLKTGKICAKYPVAPSQFSENDLKSLKDGIIADSEAQLSALTEDFTS